MALTFGGVTSDRISYGTLNSYNPLTCTILGWWYPTTFTSPRRLYSKNNTGNTLSIAARILTTGTGNIRLTRARAGSDNGVTYDTTGVFTTLNKWHFVAAVFDSGASAGNLYKCYIGDLTSAPTSVSFASVTDGSGSFDDVSGGAHVLCCNGGTSQAFQGRAANHMVIDSVLSLGQVIGLWQRMTAISGTKLLTIPGYNGTGTQPDWSGNGNAGTVTGATQVDHVPLGPPYAFTAGWRGNFTAAAPATGGPFPFYTRRSMNGGMITMSGGAI